MSGGEILTVRDARELLGLSPTADAEDARRAFRAAVRIAHPDQGGDADTLRRVVDAHRLLTDLHEARRHLLAPAVAAPKAAPAKPASPKPEPPRPLEISVAVAVAGGETLFTLPNGRQGRARLPAGLRADDIFRLKTPAGPLLFKVRFARGDMDVRGDHLWMTASVSSKLLSKGDRVALDTPHGPRSVFVTPEAATQGIVRIPGAGLPARGAHPQGHLFVRLQVDAAAETPARSLLRRFTAAWAA